VRAWRGSPKLAMAVSVPEVTLQLQSGV